MLCCSEGLLHRLQLLVPEHGLKRIEIGVGAQHEDAVELLLLLDLVRVDRKVLLADRLEVTSKTGVAVVVGTKTRWWSCRPGERNPVRLTFVA